MNHSQRLNDPQLKPWVVVTKEGMVRGAHRNCTAGMGGSCSHMAALLFKVEELVTGNRDNVSVTSKKCKWSEPSRESLKKVEYAEGRKIIFNTTQKAKKLNADGTQCQANDQDIPPLTDEEKNSLYAALSKCTSVDKKPVRPAILSVVKGYARQYIPTVVKLNLPDPLTTLYDKTQRLLSLKDLREKCEEVYHDVSVTKEQVGFILART